MEHFPMPGTIQIACNSLANPVNAGKMTGLILYFANVLILFGGLSVDIPDGSVEIFPRRAAWPQGMN